MNAFYNNEQLLKLISNIYELTDIWINIHDLSGKDIQIRNAHTAFCKTINSVPEGHARCVACDARASATCMEIKNVYRYRCHAGLCETLIPIFDSGVIISFFGFGQLLDESPIEEQWSQTAATLSWYPGDLEELHKKYLTLRQYSSQKSASLIEVLRIMASYVQFSNAITSTKYTDLQRLELYISQHYAEKLSIKSISNDLHFGATKLCSLAKTLSKGHSLTQLIALHRIRAAQDLLFSSDKSITEVAALVGYENYNYFTKVFKGIVGITPSKYRRTRSQK